MQLNNALEFAVVLAWADLSKVMTPSVLRVEYESEQGIAVDHLRVWLTTPNGNQYLVCGWSSSVISFGPRFADGHFANHLAKILGIIMKTQDGFARPAGARRGLVLVYPTDQEKHLEAAAWADGLLNAASRLPEKEGALLPSVA